MASDLSPSNQGSPDLKVQHELDYCTRIPFCNDMYVTYSFTLNSPFKPWGLSDSCPRSQIHGNRFNLPNLSRVHSKLFPVLCRLPSL